MTGQVKVIMFDDLEYLVLLRTRAVWNGNKLHDMDGHDPTTWIISGTLQSIILSFRVSIFKIKVIQGDEVKESSN